MMKDKEKSKYKSKNMNLPTPEFDAWDKNFARRESLGSNRSIRVLETGYIQSANWIEGVSGWRLTPLGIEFGATGGIFPPGSITFVDIQNIATDKILGRDTAGDGVIEQLGIGAGLSITGGNLVNTITQYTDEMAQDAVGNAVGNGLDYDDGTGAISVDESEFTTILGGTYTPTLTNVANLDASTAYECQYIRVGNVVTVSGKVDIDPTLATTSTQLGISLPIASNIGANEDCAGVAFAPGIAGQGAAILGDATNNRAQLQFISGDITNQAMYFTFTYQLLA